MVEAEAEEAHAEMEARAEAEWYSVVFRPREVKKGPAGEVWLCVLLRGRGVQRGGGMWFRCREDCDEGSRVQSGCRWRHRLPSSSTHR